MRTVISNVQPREEDIGRAAAVLFRQPINAELLQLVARKRIRSARIAPVHVPRVFEEDGGHVFLAHLLVEERLVERREIFTDV